MKILPFIAAGALAIGLAGCSGGSDCTPETLQKKAQEITTAIQQKVTSDPSKLAELMGKLQELAKKYQNVTSTSQAEACKAYDELLTTIKG